MCGIAGVIHRDGATSVGKEMTAMLQSLKHRGPDSTGFAVYGVSTADEYVMRLKLAEREDLTKDHHIGKKIRDRQAEVDALLAELGAETLEVTEPTPYAFRYGLRYPGDTRQLATDIEQIEGAEVLSFGSALELIKDLGDATRRVDAIRSRRLQRHACDRPHAHGDRVRRRYPLGASLLGVSVQRHFRRA